MNKNIIVASIIILLLFSSLAGQNISKGFTESASMLIAFIDTLLITIIMMVIPFIYRLKNRKILEYKKGRKICMINSWIVFVISIILSLNSFKNGNSNYIGVGGLGAYVFFLINMSLFVEPKSTFKKDKIINKRKHIT